MKGTVIIVLDKLKKSMQEIAKLKEGRELVERDLEELMNNSRPTCRINLFQRYREKCALLEEQNRELREVCFSTYSFLLVRLRARVCFYFNNYIKF